MLVLKIKPGDSIAFFNENYRGHIDFISIETVGSERMLWLSISYQQKKVYYHLKRFSSLWFPMENDSFLNMSFSRLTPSLIVLGITTFGEFQCLRVNGNKKYRRVDKQHLPT